ncbi:hypothetical protein ACOI1H_01335 [Loktanella sp. DJP18]|uniref:hypothetical protein n=1 Tax=Loktanella sp. DJP18 TaxID=3409788 RepID=UPI003BB7DB00
MIRSLALALMIAPAAAAQTLDAAGFNAYVAGKTLTFALPDGTTFGTEAYGTDRSVLWSTTPGSCQQGQWFERDGLICFTYTTDPAPKCWTVTRTDRGLRAESTGGTVLFEATEAPQPLVCPGPELLSRLELLP